MKRSDGERTRLVHSIAQLRASIEGLEVGLRLGGPLGLEPAQTITQWAIAIACQIAKHDAFQLAESDTVCDHSDIGQPGCPICDPRER